MRLSCIQDSIVVIIDILRASSAICTAFANGAAINNPGCGSTGGEGI